MQEKSVRMVVTKTPIELRCDETQGGQHERIAGQNAGNEPNGDRRELVGAPKQYVRRIVYETGNFYRLHYITSLDAGIMRMAVA